MVAETFKVSRTFMLKFTFNFCISSATHMRNFGGASFHHTSLELCRCSFWHPGQIDQSHDGCVNFQNQCNKEGKFALSSLLQEAKGELFWIAFCDTAAVQTSWSRQDTGTFLSSSVSAVQVCQWMISPGPASSKSNIRRIMVALVTLTCES